MHETVVNAFEDGALERFADTLRASRSSAQSEKVLAKVAAKIETYRRQRLHIKPPILQIELPFVGRHRLHRKPRVVDQHHAFEPRLGLGIGERTGFFSGSIALTSTTTHGSPDLAVGSG